MKLTEPYLFTGLQSQTLNVEIYIIDEVNDRELYVKTVPVRTKYATFKLRTEKDGLRQVFDQVVQNINEHDNAKMISRIINSIELEMVGEFEQHGNVFTLRFKVKN